jgi:replication initiation factor, repA family
MIDYEKDYYLIPKVLFQDDFYKDLIPLDVIVYSVLRNKQEEAIEKGWIDDEGSIYLAYRIEDLAKKFSCARTTMIAVLQRLESVNLIERERQWNTSYYNHNLPYMTYINEV